MKLHLLKAVVFFALIPFAFSSCLKDKIEEPTIYIEPPWWSHSSSWEETGKKIGTADWQTIPNGNRLSLSWEYGDIAKTVVVGQYHYTPTHLSIDIDTTGYIHIEDSLLSFITLRDGGRLDTTATVEYLNYGDTSLVIRHTSAAPVIEIRYKKN